VCLRLRFRVLRFGVGVKSLRFRVQGSRFRVQACAEMHPFRDLRLFGVDGLLRLRL
jgi:hypothetical protein